MEGCAEAPAAGTVLNALASGVGSAFAIDATTTATVELADDSAVTGTIAGAPGADTRLIERCVSLVTHRYGDGRGGTVRTDSDVPMAAGLKSSSAAANATVLATLAALGIDVPDRRTDAVGPAGDFHPDATPDSGADPERNDVSTVDRLTACRLGVRAAREVGVTVTGAFDDATASMLGGVTVTDNRSDALVSRRTREWDVLVWTPSEQAFSADADVERCRRLADVATHVAALALEGTYGLAMTINGLAFCAALGFPTDPLLEAMPAAHGVSLSGTGPSVTAVGDREALGTLRDTWSKREGETWLTTTRTKGARQR